MRATVFSVRRFVMARIERKFLPVADRAKAIGREPQRDQVSAGRQRPAFVTTPDNFPDHFGLVIEDTDAPAALHVPETNVERAGEDAALVRTPDDGMHVVGVSLEDALAPSGVEIPEPDRGVARAVKSAALVAKERLVEIASRKAVEK